MILLSVSDSNTRIYITIDKEFLKLVKEKAKEDDRTVSNYITRALKEKINK